MTRRPLAAALAAALGMGLCVGTAVADEPDGFWYLTDYGVEDLWAQGFDGSGATIALLDGPADPTVPWLRGADIEFFDNPICTASTLNRVPPLAAVTDHQIAASHATSMMGYYVGTGDDGAGGPALKGVAPGARVLVMPTGSFDQESAILSDTGKFGCMRRTSLTEADLDALGIDLSKEAGIRGNATGVEALEDSTVLEDVSFAIQINRAIDEGADIIHLPWGDLYGITSYPGSHMEEALLRALREGVIVVPARANNTTDGLTSVSSQPSSHNYFPGTLTVSSIDRNRWGSAYTSMVDPGVDILAPGGGFLKTDSYANDLDATFSIPEANGNSAASAIMTGYLALLISRYPEATGNQILWAVISSTQDTGGVINRDPEDMRGWGDFTFDYALASNPGKYPDTNPIFDYDVERMIDWYDSHCDIYDPAEEHPTMLADWDTIFGNLYWTMPEDPSGIWPDIRLESWWPRVMAYYDELHPDAPPRRAYDAKTDTCSTPEPTPSASSSSAPSPTVQATRDEDTSAIPAWVWFAAGGGLLLVAAIVTVAVLISRRTSVAPVPPSPPPAPYPYPPTPPQER